MHHTLVLAERALYWPNVGEDMKGYVKTYLTCQQDKAERALPMRLFEQFPVLERPWESDDEFHVGTTACWLHGIDTGSGGHSFKYGTVIPPPRIARRNKLPSYS